MGGGLAIEMEESVPLKSAGGAGGSRQQGNGAGGGAAAAAAAARHVFTEQLARSLARTLLLVLTWYVLSTALSVFNKQLVGKKHGLFGNGGFPAPMLLTGVQFFFQHLLARGVFATGLMKRNGRPLTWHDWSRLVAPNGVVTGLDIGFSNTSLVHITMSFYTMCKSTTPLFLLAFAFAFGLERPSWGLAGVVALIVSGLLLLVHGEADFDATGFSLVMAASCMSGLRFTLTQLLLQGDHGGSGGSGGGGGGGDGHHQHRHARISGSSSTGGAGDQHHHHQGLPPRSSSSNGGKHGSGANGGGQPATHSHHRSPFGGPLEVVEVLTPVMSATMLLLSLALERLWERLPGSPYFSSLGHALLTLLMIFAGALLAFLMVWAEFQVIKETSALTFMIAGTCKEVVTIIAAVLIFNDTFGAINGVGLVIVIAGVLCFNWLKLQRLRAEVRERIAAADDAAAAVAVDGGGGGGGSGGSDGSDADDELLLLGGAGAGIGGVGLGLAAGSSSRVISGGGGGAGSGSRRESPDDAEAGGGGGGSSGNRNGSPVRPSSSGLRVLVNGRGGGSGGGSGALASSGVLAGGGASGSFSAGGSARRVRSPPMAPAAAADGGGGGTSSGDDDGEAAGGVLRTLGCEPLLAVAMPGTVVRR